MNRGAGHYRTRSNRPTKEVLAGMLAELSMRGVAERTGVSKDTVRNWAVAYGLIERLHKKPRPSAEQMREMLQTMTYPEIAKATRLSSNTVCLLVAEYGLQGVSPPAARKGKRATKVRAPRPDEDMAAPFLGWERKALCRRSAGINGYRFSRQWAHE
jgi:transposase